MGHIQGGGCASGFLGGLESGTFSTARGLSGQMLSHTELARIHRRPLYTFSVSGHTASRRRVELPPPLSPTGASKSQMPLTRKKFA